MFLKTESMTMSLVASAAFLMVLLCVMGCDSDGSDDNSIYGTTDVERDGRTTGRDVDITSDRDLDRNTGAEDAIDESLEPRGSDPINNNDDWLRGGSGGVGGVDDTGGGTGRP